jgi:hypothetical protein
MKKLRNPKQWLLIVALAFLGYGVIWACAGGDWEDCYDSSFAPEAFVNSAYKPLFYSEMFYYQIGHDDSQIERFNLHIVDEWQSYLALPQADTVLSFLLLNASKQYIDSVVAHQIVLPIEFCQKITKKKMTNFLHFLQYAKANEAYAAAFIDYWGYEGAVQSTPFSAEQIALAQAMEKDFKTKLDPFLKQRYFFQIVRSYFFQAQYEQCIAFYQKYQKVFPQNIMAARTMSYAAGAHYKLKQYAQSNYLYSKVYDVAPEFKTLAYFSFHPQDEADWQQTLALCKNVEEQITLWQLLGIYFDEERAIEKIYALNPKSEKLDLLLSRLINHQEYAFHESESAKLSTDTGFGKTLALLTKIAQSNTIAKPYMWHIAAGYLYYLQSDYVHAAKYFDLSAQTMPQQALPQAQLRLFQLMNKVAAYAHVDLHTEKELLPELLWLQHIDDQQMPAFRYTNAYAWIKKTLAKHYTRQNELIKAECFDHMDSFYINPQNISALKIVLQHPKNDFEQYCADIYPYSLGQINEFEAVMLALNDQLEDAIQHMQLADEAQLFELYGNPFNGSIKDCHDCDHAAVQKTKYTKLTFLQKMKEMKQCVAQGRDVYNNSLLLGNAFYNMSFYGNARCFYEGAILVSTFVNPFFDSVISSSRFARYYYQKALSAAQNDEQRAKLTYMLLKCDRNDTYNASYTLSDMSYDLESYEGIPTIGYGNLNKYKKTAFYQDVLKECGYFRSYVAKH